MLNRIFKSKVSCVELFPELFETGLNEVSPVIGRTIFDRAETQLTDREVECFALYQMRITLDVLSKNGQVTNEFLKYCYTEMRAHCLDQAQLLEMRFKEYEDALDKDLACSATQFFPNTISRALINLVNDDSEAYVKERMGLIKLQFGLFKDFKPKLYGKTFVP